MSATIHDWTGPRASSLLLVVFKKDIPPQFAHAKPVRINFGIHGLAYGLEWNGALLTTEGRECPVHIACLNTPGWVIGLRDMSAAQHKPWSEEWRASMSGRIADRLRPAGDTERDKVGQAVANALTRDIREADAALTAKIDKLEADCRSMAARLGISYP